MAYVFAGAIVGMAVEGTKTRRSESRVNLGLAVAGASLIAFGYAGSFLPSIYSRSDFWTTSPAYFAICTGVLTLSVAAAYLWQLRPEPHRWSPIQQLGRTSLFIYWIHVEMVYGLMSQPLHRAFSLTAVFVALVFFTVAMVGVSVVKDRVAGRFKGIRPTTAASTPSGPPPLTPSA